MPGGIRRPGPSSGAGQTSAGPRREWPPSLHAPLGPTGHRQDDPGQAAGRPCGRALDQPVGSAERCEGRPSRRGRGRSRTGTGRDHGAVRGRGAPLQQSSAGRVSAPRGERHRHLHRRHHGEPLVRGECRAPVAGQGLRAQAAERYGSEPGHRSGFGTDAEHAGQP